MFFGHTSVFCSDSCCVAAVVAVAVDAAAAAVVLSQSMVNPFTPPSTPVCLLT